MNTYLNDVNSGFFYLLVAIVLIFITLMCVVFLVKSYKAGIEIGMDKQVLKKTIISSATFTLLPSISILLGVIALSGTLGVPFSWLRLSVIGALQYELNVAEIAAQSLGLPGLRLDMLDINSFVTIALVMTFGILGGVFCCIFFLKKYLGKMQAKPKKAENENAESKPGFGAYATTAMFVGLCASYIGSYIGKVFAPGDGDNLFNRGHFLAQDDAGFLRDHEAVSHLFGMERADILRRLFQNRQEPGLHRSEGFLNLFLGYQQGIHPGFVEFQIVFQQGLISVFAYIGEDLRHHRFHIHRGSDLGKDFGIWHLAILHDLDHFSSTCFCKLRQMALMASSLN